MRAHASFLAVMVAALLGWAPLSPAQLERGAGPHRELYLYKGADRD
jgi:hypothetical protein